MPSRSRVLGCGAYLPARVVSNKDLTEFVETSDEWIQSRSGIVERRWVEPDETTTSDLGLEAANSAMAAAGITKDDLDMVIFATLSPDHEFPGTACFLQAKLDCPGIPAIDVRQQCSGFVYGMAQADMFIRGGMADTVLLVGAEIHSKGMDISDDGRDVSVLFGDGAGAAVLQATEVVFVTSCKEDVDQLDAIADDVREFSGELRKLIRQQDGTYDCTEYDCDSCDDKPTCDSVRDWIKVRRKKNGDASATAARGNGSENQEGR